MVRVEPSFVLYALFLDPGCCPRAHTVLIRTVGPVEPAKNKKSPASTTLKRTSVSPFRNPAFPARHPPHPPAQRQNPTPFSWGGGAWGRGGGNRIAPSFFAEMEVFFFLCGWCHFPPRVPPALVVCSDNTPPTSHNLGGPKGGGGEGLGRFRSGWLPYWSGSGPGLVSGRSPPKSPYRPSAEAYCDLLIGLRSGVGGCQVQFPNPPPPGGGGCCALPAQQPAPYLPQVRERALFTIYYLKRP